MLTSVGRFSRPRIAMLSTVATMLCVLLASPCARAAQQYVLATASPGGTYYPVGVAIATLVKAELSVGRGIDMVAVSTAGSVENLALLEQGKADFAIVQALVGHDAWTGVRSFSQIEPHRGFRAVTALWDNVEQFVLLSKHVKSGTIRDLIDFEGARVALGKHDSGTLLSNRVLLAHLGVDIDRHYRLAYLGYGPAADALQAGEVVAIGIPAGIPTKSLTRAKAAMGTEITILSFTDAQAMQADSGLGLWAPYTIAAGTYPEQADDIKTIAQPNLLVVNADVDETDVYEIVKLIFERREFLQAMHSATETMTLNSALRGLPVPLHRGAERYFREVGLAIPQNLVDR